MIAATDNVSLNRQIAMDAPFLVNVVNIPELCNFTVPSVIRRGQLCIAISTSSISPALAKTLRIELESTYGTEFEEYLAFLKWLRMTVKTFIKDAKKRKEILSEAATPSSLAALRAGFFKQLKEHLISKVQIFYGKTDTY